MRAFIIFLFCIMQTLRADSMESIETKQDIQHFSNEAWARYGDLESLLADNTQEALQKRFEKLKNIPQEILKDFARLQIQDFDGRLKPLDTFATELMRKITHTTNFKGLQPNQFVIGLMVFPFDMMRVRFIYVGNKEILRLLGLQEGEGTFIALKDVLDMQKLQNGESFESAYKIYNFVQDAMQKMPAKQNNFDKEILKLHEKISFVQAKNIWGYLRIFPHRDIAEWFSPYSNEIAEVLTAYNDWYLGSMKTSTDVQHRTQDSKQESMQTQKMRDRTEIQDSISAQDSISTIEKVLNSARITPSFAISITALSSYLEKELLVGILKDDYSSLASVLESIHKIQQKEAQNLLSDTLVQTEIFLNRVDIFVWLEYTYFLLGILSLCVALYVLLGAKILHTFYARGFFIALFLLFLCHTIALCVRWYIAGHAPWSNAYESMVYIAWASILAALLLRKSFLMLCGASFFAGITLMVAHLGAMDPQISNLVPVLQSYWLNIHVSVIVASYGFCGLCAMLGIFSLLLYILRDEKRARIDRAILLLTVLNERSMILGLIMLTIGTFLGGIWANESWGRYWGWDAKETWSLASIAVYACILHIRMFVKKNLPYIFNVLSVLGFYSILMTYFGVNYYLAGMHSYAKGDAEDLQFIELLPHIILFCLMAFAWRKRGLAMIIV